MMIPYPSSSSTPVNKTVLTESIDSVGIAVGGAAVGALTLGTGFLILRSLRKVTQSEQPSEQPTEQQSNNEEVAYICVNSSELEEIKQLLVVNQKRFIVNRTYSHRNT